MTADEYATALALASCPVIAAAHRGVDAGPFITKALAIEPPDGVNAAYTLITLVAAQVNPDTTLSERLRWTEPAVQAACRTERAA